MATERTTSPLVGYGIGVLEAAAAGLLGAVGFSTINAYSLVGGGLLVLGSLALVALTCTNVELVDAVPD